jgi:hypothetical protein
MVPSDHPRCQVWTLMVDRQGELRSAELAGRLGDGYEPGAELTDLLAAEMKEGSPVRRVPKAIIYSVGPAGLAFLRANGPIPGIE